MHVSGGPDRSRFDSGEEVEWFRQAFDEFYVSLYAHRDEVEAARLIELLRRRFRLRGPVLDVACGPGRFLQALKKGEDRPIGLDLSRPLLDRARRVLAPEPPPLIQADMRSLPLRAEAVPWALLLFTSFGYFAQRDEDRGVLLELRRVLAPRGGLALDFLNAPRVLRELVPESAREVLGRKVRETRWCDPAGPFLRKRVQVGPERPGWPEVVYEERIRLYSPNELQGLVAEAGFRVESVLGDYEGTPFTESGSPRCLIIGRKETET